MAASLPDWWPTAAAGSVCTPPRGAAASMERAASEAHFDAPAIVSDLCRRGYTVVDRFLSSTSAATEVRSGIESLDRAGRLRLGKIQSGTNQSANTSSRTDRIAFLPSIQPRSEKQKANAAASTVIPVEECPAALRAFTQAADAMRAQLTEQDRLVDRVGGSLDDCNFMCACYPGGGARYVKHRDALPYKAGRKLTVIYYLNAAWRPGDGGELRIWPSADEDSEGEGEEEEQAMAPVTIEPLADRLVIFISSQWHEVLPAWKPRYALTTWMFNRRDTALEVLAEEMRQRKAKGTLNTQALLAAIEADSSEDDEETEEEEEEEEGVSRGAAMSVMMMLLKKKQQKEKAAKAAQAQAANGKAAVEVQ